MQFYNLKAHNEQVSFTEAVKRGLGKQQGLFFPVTLPEFTPKETEALLQQDFITRSLTVLSAFIGDEIPQDQLNQAVKNAFSFPAPLVWIDKRIAILELFHGPTLAFKDFGARFMAQMLSIVAKEDPVTILTATSGDTGAAVANAFFGLKNIQVVILYPRGKISPLQEKLFCTLDQNIHTLSVEGDFDACQSMVKQAFEDIALRKTLSLNSANSINISRLIAQICYYFEAVAQISPGQRNELVISVPSGNFGNLTAGLLAKAMGLPIKRFIAATNVNDTVPRFLSNGQWRPEPAKATLSNAMDVSEPNNWPRIEALFRHQNRSLKELGCGVVTDKTTQKTLVELYKSGCLCEPHAAVAYRLLRDQLQAGECGIFLGTAHPAKFKEKVEPVLECQIDLPPELAERADLPLLSKHLSADYASLSSFLRGLPVSS